MSASPDNLPDFKLIIPAAGRGTRMGAALPKQYMEIDGKAVLTHTVERFHAMPNCVQICVIIGAEDADKAHECLKDFDKVITTAGGKERKDSVSNALETLIDAKPEDLVLIHDAARPCVHPEEINSILHEMTFERSATLATRVSSTLRKANDKHYAANNIDRENLWAIHTPQAFKYGDIVNAHKRAKPNHTYTDDSALVSALGIPVKLVEGRSTNIKITTPADMKLAEFLLKEQF